MSDFQTYKIRPEIIKALDELGFKELFPIQKRVLEPLFAGKDVIGQSQTGTGKTAAFAIPMLERLNKNMGEVQALVLTPTRELAVQVATEIKKFGKYLGFRVAIVYGGQRIPLQLKVFKSRSIDIVVGTPGRIIDHLERRTFRLNAIRVVVIDEADMMFDMGFKRDVEHILDHTSVKRQIGLFSATMSHEITKLANKYLKNPEKIFINEDESSPKSIKQLYIRIERKEKRKYLNWIIDNYKIKQAIIFCNTKWMVTQLSDRLKRDGYPAIAIHGDLKQSQRDRSMERFREGGEILLVATDVAARGLDIPQTTHVINYDIPRYTDIYWHRIGRTARAGRTGTAITLVTMQENMELKKIISAKDNHIEEIFSRDNDKSEIEEVDKKMKLNVKLTDSKTSQLQDICKENNWTISEGIEKAIELLRTTTLNNNESEIKLKDDKKLELNKYITKEVLKIMKVKLTVSK